MISRSARVFFICFGAGMFTLGAVQTVFFEILRSAGAASFARTLDYLPDYLSGLAFFCLAFRSKGSSAITIFSGVLSAAGKLAHVFWVGSPLDLVTGTVYSGGCLWAVSLALRKLYGIGWLPLVRLAAFAVPAPSVSFLKASRGSTRLPLPEVDVSVEAGLFSPRFSRDVSLLLSSVPSRRLAGIGTVALLTSRELPRRDRRRAVDVAGSKVVLGSAHGFYAHSSASRAGTITIAVDQIFQRPTSLALRVPILRRMLLCRTLFHEVGHHIHHTTSREHKDREQVADNWSVALFWRFLFRRYIFAIPFMVLLAAFYRPFLRPAHGTRQSSS